MLLEKESAFEWEAVILGEPQFLRQQLQALKDFGEASASLPTE
jgi:hypothetical protein